jgi:hypothetical protein
MSLVQTVYAQANTVVTSPIASQYNNLAGVFGAAINIVMGVGIALTVIFLILGGIQYITSKGDQKAAQQARDWLTNAVIGFIVVLAALAIKNIVGGFLGGNANNANFDPSQSNVVPF